MNVSSPPGGGGELVFIGGGGGELVFIGGREPARLGG
jgi:hypothetical protein